jgi:WD40 repeat protein
VASGREERLFNVTWVRALTFASDGRSCAVARGGAIRLLPWPPHPDALPLTDPDATVNLVAPSPDGRTVATAGYNDRAIFVWDAATGQLRRRLAGHGGRVSGLAWTPDGATLLSTGGDPRLPDGEPPRLRRWDAATGRERPAQPGFDKPFTSFLLSPDGSLLVARHDDNKPAVVWDAATGRELRTLAGDGSPLAFTPDGRTLLGWRDKAASVWDVATGRELRRFAAGHPDRTYCAAFSRDGRRLALGGQEHFLLVYDVADGKELARVPVPGTLSALAFSPDGRALAAGDWAGGTVRLWDTATWTEARTLPGHRGRVLTLAFTADGKRLVSGSEDTTALVWDVSDLRPPKP